MNFSKKIVKWAIWYTTLSTLLWAGVYIAKGQISDALIGLTGTVITGVIVSYSVKAGAENYQKIKTTKKESEESI